jgi:hypothetical protein
VEELGFRFTATPLEHVQSERAVAAQLGAKAARRRGLLVRLEKPWIRLQRTPHAEDGQREIRRRESLERTKVGRTLADRPFEAVDGPFASSARALAPEVPSLPHELVRSRHFQGVAELRPLDDPSAVLTEMAPHFADRDVDGVGRDVRSLPRLDDHRVVVDKRPLMLQQHSQRSERERPQPYVHAVSRQPGRGGAQAEGAKGEFRHRHTVRTRQSRHHRSAGGDIDSVEPRCYDSRLDAVHYTQQMLRAPVTRACAWHAGDRT